jgi:hypothetical protein
VQQVEMLSELPMVEKSRPRAKFLPNIFLILAMLANARIAKSQSSEFLATEGRTCGTGKIDLLTRCHGVFLGGDSVACSRKSSSKAAALQTSFEKAAKRLNPLSIAIMLA